MKLTLRFFLALRWKDLVANAYFDIIGFTCKDQQGLILGLQPKRAIVPSLPFRFSDPLVWKGWIRFNFARRI